jgi:hypothetical protein
VHKNDRLRRATDDLEKFELISERAAKQHLRRGEIPEDEFVALLGNFRRSSDIDDERYAFLFRNLGNGSGLARIECTNEDLRAITDELLGALARNIDIGLGVGVDDCQFGQAQRFEDARCDIDATLTVLTDARFESGFRQQDTDRRRRWREGGGGLSKRGPAWRYPPIYPW